MKLSVLILSALLAKQAHCWCFLHFCTSDTDLQERLRRANTMRRIVKIARDENATIHAMNLLLEAELLHFREEVSRNFTNFRRDFRGLLDRTENCTCALLLLRHNAELNCTKKRIENYLKNNENGIFNATLNATLQAEKTLNETVADRESCESAGQCRQMVEMYRLQILENRRNFDRASEETGDEAKMHLDSLLEYAEQLMDVAKDDFRKCVAQRLGAQRIHRKGIT